MKRFFAIAVLCGSFAYAADDDKSLTDALGDLSKLTDGLDSVLADASKKMDLTLEGSQVMLDNLSKMDLDEMNKHNEYMDALTDDEDKTALSIAFAKDKKGETLDANEKKQLAAYNKAVYGSETGGPSG